MKLPIPGGTGKPGPRYCPACLSFWSVKDLRTLHETCQAELTRLRDHRQGATT